jgi:hypothetical protein
VETHFRRAKIILRKRWQRNAGLDVSANGSDSNTVSVTPLVASSTFNG